MYLLGVLDCTEGYRWFSSTPRLDGEGFITFLRALGCVPEAGPARVMDNAPAHHAKKVGKFVKQQQGRLDLLFLPPNSPRLNPIEKFWACLRGEVTHNTNYDSYGDFQGEVVEFLRRFKAPNQKVRDLCQMHYNPNPIPVEAL